MNSILRFSVVVSVLVVSASLARSQGLSDPSARTAEIPNWAAPPYWKPPAQPVSVQEREGGAKIEAIEALSTSPLPFIGITPCRVVDTRGNGFTGAYGPPALVGNGPARIFNIPAGPCPGIPATAGAYSVNVAAILPASDGFMTVFPTGTPQPNSSDLNFLGGEVIGNAIVAPAGTGGAISIFVNVSTDMILDINGYYAPSGAGNNNTFLGWDAGNFTMSGFDNTGIGSGALRSNTTGYKNTAIGQAALISNTTGHTNTAVGDGALYSVDASTGSNNTAIGAGALEFNTSGSDNTAIGTVALGNPFTTTTGSGNIAIGYLAGISRVTGNSNIDIGNFGIGVESATIRIGTSGTHTRAFLAGVRGMTTGMNDAVPVMIDSAGQLGTVSSSQRAKQDIEDMADVSKAVMKLRPVTFRYKPPLDPTGSAQFGLIAEEVAEVFPELVVFDREGQPETVRYHVLPALLLNELQKQHRTVEAQEKALEQQSETINYQRFEIEELKDRLSNLEARLTVLSRQ